MKLTFKEIGDRLPVDVITEFFENWDFHEGETIPTLESIINDFCNGDLDITVPHLEGATFQIDEEGITVTNKQKDIEVLKRIADLMDTEEHMDLYKKHGLSHDGGDDFDYGGSFLYDLISLIEVFPME